MPYQETRVLADICNSQFVPLSARQEPRQAGEVVQRAGSSATNPDNTCRCEVFG
jgi:hypothetical protein